MIRVCVFMIFFLPIIGLCQNAGEGKIHYYFTLFGQTEGKLAPSDKSFTEFLTRLEDRRPSFRNDKAFVHHVFTKGHQQFFRKFEEYSSFAELISKGNYNCLTGTAFFGLLLDHFEIEYRIIETNHHIYLLAETAEGTIFLETTDAMNGFVTDLRLMKQRIATYNEVAPERRISDGGVHNFRYPRLYNDTVTLTGVLGLLHYNHSIDAFNRRDYKMAIAHLSHALLLKQSEKLEMYHQVLFTTIRFDESLRDETRQNYITRLRALQEKRRNRISRVLMVPLIR